MQKDKLVKFILNDSFISQITKTASSFNPSISPAYFFGRLAHGSRISIAMNVRTNKEIGHPSGEYCWDIVGVFMNCFEDTGITAKMYVGSGYFSRARKTAAQSKRSLSNTIKIIDDHKDLLKIKNQGKLIYPNQNGKWLTVNNPKEIDFNWDDLPFGPVIIDFIDFEKQTTFPKNTFQYIIDTIERGEEPMEIRGHNDYSTISGWKAFARWMHSFAFNQSLSQHDFLNTLPNRLIERRHHFILFLEELLSLNSLNDIETELISKLKEKYELILNEFKNELHGKIELNNIKTIYFIEQKSLTIYKKISHYLSQSNK